MELYHKVMNKMKNYITKVLVATFVAIFTLSCADKAPISEPIWDGATVVFYINMGDLHSKSGLSNMDLSKFEQQIDSCANGHKREAALLKSLMRNPNISGFNLDKPAYLAFGEYINDTNKYNAIASIEIKSATEVDTFLKGLAKNFKDATFALEGNKRIISDVEEGVIIGYDDKRLVLIASEDKTCDLHSVLLQHMKYFAADLSRFANYDAAAYLDINKTYELASALNNTADDEESDEIDIDEYFSENATVVTGISFDRGSLTYDTNFTGVRDEVSKFFKEINGQSLSRLKPSPIALLNIGVNGEAFAELANKAIDTAMKTLGGASNEFSIYKNVALGVVASINGDLMFALTDANGTISEDALGDKRPLFTSADALFAAEVSDDYIMKNIDTYAGNLLTKQKNGYSIEAFGNKLTITQQEKLFYVGVNNDGELKKPSAADQEWFNNVIGGYLFAMIDFNQLFKSGYGRTALTVILDRIKNPDDLEGAKRLISWVDKTYISINGKEDSVRGELMIITRNKSKNSLQSIVELYYDLAFN